MTPSSIRARMGLTLLLLVAIHSRLNAQTFTGVNYNFQTPDVVTDVTTAPGTVLTMDWLAANGYGQWTSTGSTINNAVPSPGTPAPAACLLSNRLTASTTKVQDGIIAARPFHSNKYPGAGEPIRVVTNLQGQTRYVQIYHASTGDQLIVEGFNPNDPEATGALSVNVDFVGVPDLPAREVVKSSATIDEHDYLIGGRVVTATDEADPNDRIDAAMDASFLYIVWEQVDHTVTPAVFSIHALTISLSSPATTSSFTFATSGIRPTVAADVRHSGAVSFDVAYITAATNGSVEWVQVNGGTVSTAVPMPTSFGSSLNWLNPQHVRMLDASAAWMTPSAGAQRAIYIIADYNGWNLFLDRINGGPAPLGEYCDGYLNLSRPPGSRLETTLGFAVVNKHLRGFTNPYDGNPNSVISSTPFNEFHCLYELDRKTGAPLYTHLNYPLMIIPGSEPARGFCVNEQPASSPTTFYDDATWYIGAANQQGLHIHWRNSGTTKHYYRRDMRFIDEDIEETTLLTGENHVKDGTSHFGSYTPTLAANKTLSLYSDPAFVNPTGTYTGASVLSLDNSSDVAKTINLKIGSSTAANANFVIVGRFTLGMATRCKIEIGQDNSFNYYGYANSDLDFRGGSLALTGSGHDNNTTSVSTYATVSSHHPAKMFIYPGTHLALLSTFVATDSYIEFPYGNDVMGGTNPVGGIGLYQNANFTTCEIRAKGSRPYNTETISIIQNNDNDYAGTTHYTVTLDHCYLLAQDAGGGVQSSKLLLPGHGFSSELDVSGGKFDGYLISGQQLHWPFNIEYATFDHIPGIGINVDETGSIARGTTISQTYGYTINLLRNDFMTFNTGVVANAFEGIRVTGAADPFHLTDHLREAITVTYNTFTTGGSDLPNAAIHFSDATGDIGYNNITASKYLFGIVNESSTSLFQDATISLICSNTITNLNRTGAAGLLTDNYIGYAKLNQISHCTTDHSSGVSDQGHVVFSDYTHASGAGFTSTDATSTVDMAGVHHSGGVGDLAAFNIISDNGGPALSLADGSKLFLGLAAFVGTPTWSVYGENAITSVASNTLIVSGAVDLKNIDNNYWGANIDPSASGSTLTNWNTATTSEVDASGLTGLIANNSLSSAPAIPAVACSDGLVPFFKHKEHIASDPGLDSYCGHLGQSGQLLLNDGNGKPAYDSLRLYLELCYNQKYAYDAFGSVGAALGQWGEGGPTRYLDFFNWLKKVLYYSPDTNWYCRDVLEMFTALGYNGDRGIDESGKEAIAQYMLQTNKCPLLNNDWRTYYNTANHWRYQLWKDSVSVDTLRFPYDSTLPSLEQVGAEVLRGKPAGVSASGPAAEHALASLVVVENPFKGDLTVRLDMARSALVTFSLYDLLGKSIAIDRARMLFEPRGNRSETLHFTALPSGTYYLRASTDGGEVKTVKVAKE